jgi:hypothetical protein
MLLLPAHDHKQFPTGETVTIFRDDSQISKFYLIPGFPTVRTDPNNNPVFQLIKYNISDQSREENPELPRGGGYMVFDSELKVKTEHQEEIVKELEQYVAAEWEKLKKQPDDRIRALTMGATFNDIIGEHWSKAGMAGGPRASSTSGMPSMTLTMPGSGFVPPSQSEAPPPVIIGEPLWKSGSVKMNAPQSAALVTKTLGERPASLIGNNVAAFSIDLTPDGASFMEQTLVGRDGRGATDLTPIQVEYKLTMLAKLPPATMYVRFNTASLYHAVQELFHEHHNCTDDYFTSETMMTSAIEAGLVTIKIDTGGIQDEDILQMLMQQATSIVQELLANRFAEKERAPLEEWANDDIAESSAEVYRLKRVTEIDMTNFEQTMEIKPTTEWTIAPQGTLQAFFTKVQDMSRFVRVVNLNDAFFRTLGLSARAFANWAEDEVAFVELEVKYEQGGEIKVNTFTFTPDDKEPQKWDPSLINGKRDYQYRWRVGFEGRAPGDWSKWEKTTTRDLNVSVATPGKLDVEVTGVGLDFENVLDAALVHLRYSDPANDIPMIGQSVLLSKERASGKWLRQLFAPWNRPVEYRVEYLLKSGTTVEKDWTPTTGPTQNILVARPNVDVLDLTLIPAGRWSDVIQSVLSVRYADGSYQKDAQFNFTKQEEFKKWAVLLLNNSRRKFEYKIVTTFKNGDVQETAWLTREGDQALPVLVEGPPRLDVKVVGAVLDFASTPLTKIDLEYSDPQGIRDVQSISLQKADDAVLWSVPIRKDGPRTYRYKTTYFPADGTPVERDWEVTETELVVVPRYSIPKVGADFSPKLQDFTLTPAVEVNLTYDDAQRGPEAHQSRTLLFTSGEPQKWFIPVPDTAPRTYEMTVTWYYADGRDKTSLPVRLEKSAVLLPRAPRD